ncbi:MAG: SDR family oxidoreductase [Pseudonocardia sp.]|nr:SDR family oxidoreductase [Pseudonocardia sp.]MBO0872549.1 SDR family oxidoreductase [Pseudonocardia sp.]
MTGATGIAAATARGLAAQGCRVHVLSLDAPECAALSDGLGPASAGWTAVDLRQDAAVESAFTSATTALGGLDAVVAVAGGSGRRFGDGPLHELTLSAWDETLRLNLTSAFLTAREAVRAFRAGGAGGSLVLTASVLASAPAVPYFETHAYAAAKAAIEGLATALAASYARERIRVNAVAPGLVRTRMARRAAQDPAISDYARRKQALVGGFLAAEQVAEALCWFATGADAVTGQVLDVDGSWSVTQASP